MDFVFACECGEIIKAPNKQALYSKKSYHRKTKKHQRALQKIGSLAHIKDIENHHKTLYQQNTLLKSQIEDLSLLTTSLFKFIYTTLDDPTYLEPYRPIYSTLHNHILSQNKTNLEKYIQHQQQIYIDQYKSLLTKQKSINDTLLSLQTEYTYLQHKMDETKLNDTELNRFNHIKEQIDITIPNKLTDIQSNIPNIRNHINETDRQRIYDEIHTISPINQQITSHHSSPTIDNELFNTLSQAYSSFIKDKQTIHTLSNQIKQIDNQAHAIKTKLYNSPKEEHTQIKQSYQKFIHDNAPIKSQYNKLVEIYDKHITTIFITLDKIRSKYPDNWIQQCSNIITDIDLLLPHSTLSSNTAFATLVHTIQQNQKQSCLNHPEVSYPSQPILDQATNS